MGSRTEPLRGAFLARTEAGACLSPQSELWEVGVLEGGGGCPRRVSPLWPRSLHRFLLCNLHVVLLTVIKVPLLGGLLCTLMWRSRSQGTPRGNKSVFAGDRSPHAIKTLAWD